MAGGVKWAAMDPRSSGSFEEQMAALRARVWRLEQTLADHGIALREEPVRTPPVAPTPAVETASAPAAAQGGAGQVLGSAQAAPAAPLFAAVAAGPEREERSLESRIGSQWFNRIGILAVLILSLIHI